MSAPFDLTTLSRVKALAPIDVPDSDTVIEDQLIPQWSGRVAAMLGREIEIAQRTQVFTLRRFQRLVTLPAFPVSAIASVSYGARQDDLSELELYTDWFQEGDRHVRLTDVFVPSYEPGFLSVTWTGGMALGTVDFIDSYPELAGALDMQIVHALKRRGDPGSQTESFAGGSIVHTNSLELLPELREALGLYTRRVAL